MDVDYFRGFNLNREPFSISPDPDFLYQSRQHFGILQFLENSIRTGSGVNLVIGAPGTGKTTLCRHLCIKMSYESNIDIHLLNARFCDTVKQFEEDVIRAFEITDKVKSSGMKTEDKVFNHFSEKNKKQNTTAALIIDDGHMIPECCFGFLDKIASLEVDGHNLIQLVIFANREFRENLKGNSGLENIITNIRILGPLNFSDTRHMIGYRLKIASNSIKKNVLFTYPGMLAIYLATGGYPKKIVKLCHRCILSMKTRNLMKGGWLLVRSNARQVLAERSFFPESFITALFFIVPVIVIIAISMQVYDVQVFKNKYSVITRDGHKPTVPEAESIEIPTIELKNDNDQRTITEISKTEEEYKKSLPAEPEIVKEKTIPAEPAIADETPIPTIYSPPDLIGIVEVKRGDTLLVMLEKVYGHSQKKYRTPVLETNKHIVNIHSLEIGDLIKFPPLRASVTPPDGEKYWVEVAEKETLNNSYEYLRSWPVNAPRIKIISLFSPSSGMKFSIVLRKNFNTQDLARGALNTLPLVPSTEINIIQFDFTESVYYADPFFK